MTTPYYSDATVQLHHGDCLDVLRGLPDNSVDSVVTDPPYGLEFMGKEWDAPWKQGADVHAEARTMRAGEMGDENKRRYIASSVNKYEAGRPFQQWCEQWARECLRVLKPGGHLLAFGGTRTWHRLACAVEDAGFEVRDSIAWMYGSGFPKSLDVSKAIDKAAGAEREVVGYREEMGYPDGGTAVERNRKGTTTIGMAAAPGGVPIMPPATPDAERWQGWGTALKPAFEPVVVARKPLTAGTVAANVLKWGCGALNIDGTRIQPDGGSGEGIGGEAATRGCRVHDVRLVRSADGAMEVAGGPSEVADDLRPALSLGADARGEQPQLAGRRLDGGPLGVSGGVGAEPLTGGSGASTEAATQGVPRAPAGDGAEARPASHAGRDGASPERGEGGQPTRESAPDGLGDSLQGARPDRARPESPTSGERSTAGCTCGADREVTRSGEASADRRYTERGGTNFAPLPGVRGGSPGGRWPANVVLDESQAAELDQMSGEARSAGLYVKGSRGFDPETGKRGDAPFGVDGLTSSTYDDSGGASRFMYVAKAGADERVRVAGIAHPTVKPLALMRWLVRLVTPPGGTVLEPFAGSGTTVEACILEGFHCLAIEREADYLPLIVQRINRRRDPVAAVIAQGDDAGLFDLLDGEPA